MEGTKPLGMKRVVESITQFTKLAGGFDAGGCQGVKQARCVDGHRVRHRRRVILLDA